MDRSEHLAWAKERALLELEPGGRTGSRRWHRSNRTSVSSRSCRVIRRWGLMMPLAFRGHLSSDRQVREFIEGLG